MQGTDHSPRRTVVLASHSPAVQGQLLDLERKDGNCIPVAGISLRHVRRPHRHVHHTSTFSGTSGTPGTLRGCSLVTCGPTGFRQWKASLRAGGGLRLLEPTEPTPTVPGKCRSHGSAVFMYALHTPVTSVVQCGPYTNMVSEPRMLIPTIPFDYLCKYHLSIGFATGRPLSAF